MNPVKGSHGASDPALRKNPQHLPSANRGASDGVKILVVGAGMYVTGRGTNGPGTVLPALAQISKSAKIDRVVVAATKSKNAAQVLKTAQAVNRKIGSRLKVEYRTIDRLNSGGLDRNRFDCAIVSVPDHLHFEYARRLISAGIHCLVVKPLVPTLAEAQELVRLQKEKGVYGAVEFHKRWDETNLVAKRILAEGKLGRLLYFTVDYSQRIRIPLEVFAGWSERTNIFQYLGVHYVDLIYFLTGFKPFKVMAVGTRGVLESRGVRTFDSVHVASLWRNPKDADDTFVAQFSTNWIDPNCTSALSDQKYKVIGARGRLELDQKNRGVELVTESEGVQHVNPTFSEFLPDSAGNLAFSGYGHRSIERFILDVHDIQRRRVRPESLDKIRPTFKQALVSTAMIESVNRSLVEDSQWVPVDDPTT